MIILLVLLLPILSDELINKHEPPDQDHQLVHGLNPVDKHQQLKMEDFQQHQVSPIDPKAPLSNTDLARLLMQYCSDRIKEERCFTKELINDKSEVVIAGVIKGMGESLAVITETINKQNHKIETMELNLSYLEQLLYKQLSDQAPVTGSPSSSNCSACIKNAKAPGSIHDNHFHCNSCNTIFRSVKGLYLHICTPHTIPSPCGCWSCGETFVNERELKEYIDCMHASKATIPCELCNKTFSTMDQLSEHRLSCHAWNLSLQDGNLPSIHTASVHAESTVVEQPLEPEQLSPPACQDVLHYACEFCGFITSSNNNLRDHIVFCHDIKGTELHCNKCKATFMDMRTLNIHLKENHKPDSVQLEVNQENCDILEISDIIQVDGIDDTMESAALSTKSSDPRRVLPCNPQDLTFNYSLNAENQANRLIKGAHRPPMSVTYNNFQTINDVQCALNATIECNSGVYLTAIKPALQAVTLDWSIEIDQWAVLCTMVSNRQDSTGMHLVNTQLKLSITSKEQDSAISHQITLHFYHTNDKILIQSSSIMSPGISAAAWLVKRFIEPLATEHVANHQHSIDEVNSAILSSSVSSGDLVCSSCASKILSTACKAKDQPLGCIKCNRTFHKKCTNRSGARSSNWNKDPWICPDCTCTVPAVGQTEETPRSAQSLLSLPLYTTGPSTIPTTRQGPSMSPVAILSQRRAFSLQEDEGLDDDNDEVRANDVSTPVLRNQALLHVPAVNTLASQPQRYPNNSIRQRNSNIAAMHPEQEFHKAALDACRSTIVQQEADIKTLKESLDIRNKKILQLEGQVGVAKSYLSARDPTPKDYSPATEEFSHLKAVIDMIMTKLSSISDNFSVRPPVVNVYNSTCHSSKPLMTSTSTQTLANTVPTIPTDTFTTDTLLDDEMDEAGATEAILTCTICHNTFQSNQQLDSHMENHHDSKPSESSVYNCDFCSDKFTNGRALETHISTKHPADYLSCNNCKLRFQTKQQLSKHLETQHASPSTATIQAPSARLSSTISETL